MNEQLYSQFDDFVKGISNKDKIALIHDIDPDGICSGVVTHHALQRLRGRGIDVVHHQKHGEIPLTKKTLEVLKNKKITKVITTDKAVDQEPEIVEDIAQFADVLIIDHHKVYFDFNQRKYPHRILLMKPQILGSPVDPSRYCTSKLAYDLWSRHVDLEDVAWKACPGIVGDIAYASWKNFVDKEIKKYKGRTPKNPFDNIFGRIAELISQTECYDYRQMKKVFQILFTARRPHEVLNSSLKKYAKVIQKEIDYYAKNVKKLAEFHPGKELIFYFLKSAHNIKSNLSTILSMKYPHMTLITCADQGTFVALSLRRQDQKVKMNDLVEKALQGLEGSGGGHIPAAGGG